MLTYQRILPYIANGLITEQRHPSCESLAIFNYTAACQYSQTWDDVTRQCRGLIMNLDTERIIARPFLLSQEGQKHIGKLQRNG